MCKNEILIRNIECYTKFMKCICFDYTRVMWWNRYIHAAWWRTSQSNSIICWTLSEFDCLLTSLALEEIKNLLSQLLVVAWLLSQYNGQVEPKYNLNKLVLAVLISYRIFQKQIYVFHNQIFIDASVRTTLNKFQAIVINTAY